MKKHIPNILTLGNLFCGGVGIILILDGMVWPALSMMLLAALFDFLDGFVARALKVSGPLGAQLDSLADMVTFGALPGVMMYTLMVKTQPEGSYLPFIGLLIAVFSGYRLAVFNISDDQSDNFIGVPTPINAIFIGSLTLITHDLLSNFWLLLGITLISSWLLISPLKMIALKFKGFGFKENLARWLLIAISIILIFTLKIAAIPFILLVYVLISILHFRLKLI